MSEDLSQVVTVIGPGGNFGELGFLFGSPRTATVRAATHCELVMLSRYDMNHVVESFPLLAKCVFVTCTCICMAYLYMYLHWTK